MFGRRRRTDDPNQPPTIEVGALRARVQTDRYHQWVAHVERWNGSRWEQWGAWADRQFGHSERDRSRPTGCTIDHHSRESAEAAACEVMDRVRNWKMVPAPDPSFVYEEDCA